MNFRSTGVKKWKLYWTCFLTCDLQTCQTLQRWSLFHLPKGQFVLWVSSNQIWGTRFYSVGRVSSYHTMHPCSRILDAIFIRGELISTFRRLSIWELSWKHCGMWLAQVSPCNERAVLIQLLEYFQRRLAGYKSSDTTEVPAWILLVWLETV